MSDPKCPNFGDSDTMVVRDLNKPRRIRQITKEADPAPAATPPPAPAKPKAK